MSGRVTLGVGLSYQLGRVTLLGGPAFVYLSHVNAQDRVTPGGGLSRIASNDIK